MYLLSRRLNVRLSEIYPKEKNRSRNCMPRGAFFILKSPIISKTTAKIPIGKNKE
jgi:hypothetical protein